LNPKVQQYFLDVIEDRRKDATSKIVARALWALSRVYAVLVQLRKVLYHHGLFRRKTLGCMIISVGNLTVGGTGKTPVVEMFAKSLCEGGRHVAVLSRGYKRKRRLSFKNITRRWIHYQPEIVSDGQRVLLSSAEAGDEPYMLAKNLPNVAVVVGKNRVKTGSYAIDKMGVDTLILDDGFQYLALGRRVDVVLVDATNPFGNGELLPRGILREPLKNLARADFVFLTKAEGVPTQEIIKRLEALNPRAPIIECQHESKHLVELATGTQKALSYLGGKRVAVLTAIASPGSFEKALKDLGAELAITIRYPDHHRFTTREVNDVIKTMSRKNVEAIITTEKDAVRFPSMQKKGVPVYFLRVEIRIRSGLRDFNDCVARLCNI
jgi:tetraacyldisaccharide 4'-kinase